MLWMKRYHGSVDTNKETKESQHCAKNKDTKGGWHITSKFLIFEVRLSPRREVLLWPKTAQNEYARYSREYEIVRWWNLRTRTSARLCAHFIRANSKRSPIRAEHVFEYMWDAVHENIGKMNALIDIPTVWIRITASETSLSGAIKMKHYSDI